MSDANRKFTVSGRGRTFSDRAPYLKPQFWADPKNHFWESPSYTEEGKAYFRKNLEVMLSNIHNQIRIENSQQI